MEGNCKGTIYRGNIDYVKRRFGEDGLKKLIQAMNAKGHRYDFANLKPGAWYPLDARLEFLRTTVEMWDLDDTEVRKLGRSGMKLSTIAQLYLKIAGSPKKIFEIAPKMWNQNYDTGRLEAELNGGSGSYFRIYDFEGDPLLCTYLMGYYEEVMANAKMPETVIVETKCVFKGDDLHEYKFTW